MKTIRKLIKENRIQPAGLAIYEQRKEKHSEAYENMKKDFVLPEEYLEELKTDPEAHDYYLNLPPGYKKQAMRWIMTAKKEETRDRRFSRFLESCKTKERLY